MRRSILILAALAGCHAAGQPTISQEDPALGGARSGRRLKLVVWQPESGSPFIGGVRDTELKEDCQHEWTLGGVGRCTPERAADVTYTGYADATCTKLVLVGVPPDVRWVVGQKADPDGCTASAVVYRVGAAVTVPQVYRWEGGGRCGPYNFFKGPQAGFEITEVTDTLAKLEEKPGTAVGGIAPLWRDGPDGAHLFDGWLDVVHGTDCSFKWGFSGPVLAEDGSIRCLPASRDGDRAYADDQCTLETVGLRHGPCRYENGIRNVRVSDSCPPRARLSGPTVPVTAGYQMISGSCQPQTTSAFMNDHWLRREAIAPDTLPAGSISAPEGSGRVQIRFLTTAAGRAPYGAWDDTLKTDCVAAQLPDGNAYCVPLTPLLARLDPSDRYFADDQCRQEVTRLFSIEGKICGQWRYAIQGDYPGDWRWLSLTKIQAVFPVEPYEGPAFHLIGGNCGAYGSISGWKLGPALAPAQLALLRRVEM